MKTPQRIVAGLTASALITLTACTPTQQQYALGGAVAGGAVGAIAGDDSSDIIKGIAVGGAAGAGVGAYQEHQRNQNGNYNKPSNDGYRQPAPKTTPRYPYATRTDEAGVVRSPYKPYNKVRISGMKSGDLAREPGQTDIFLVP